jgi:RNA polymerase sigma-70 factor (ECF subfamily)
MHRDATFEDAVRPELAEAAFVMDEEAFRAFYDRTARGVWAYLWRVTGDRGVADDLLQESYYRFLRSTADHASEPHRRNALYRIATNLARDRWRRNAARPVTELNGEEAAPAADVEGRTDLKRALARLNPRERAMLWLAYAEGASHEEIAGVLGVKASSMKVLLFRARRRLAELLGRR